MTDVRIETLAEHQINPEGTGCECGETIYTFPPPYRETLYQHAKHQHAKISFTIPEGSYCNCDWDDE